MNPGNDVPWELPPEYHDEPDPPPPNDCLNCGVCEWCIERSITAAEEWPDFFADECPHCRGTGWQDCGLIAIECPECGGTDA